MKTFYWSLRGDTAQYSKSAALRETRNAFNVLNEQLAGAVQFLESTSLSQVDHDRITILFSPHPEFPIAVARHREIVDGVHELLFDPRARWNIGFWRSLLNSKHDYRTYLFHEIGHTLGLDHGGPGIMSPFALFPQRKLDDGEVKEFIDAANNI